MSATTDNGSGSRLLNLPVKIREHVCTLALIDVESIEIFSPSSRRAAALAQTCRQLRRETINIFYAQNTFALNLTASTLPKAVKWLHGIGEDRVSQIFKFIIRFSVDVQTQQQRDDAARACVSAPWPSPTALGATSMGALVVDCVGAREELHKTGREFAQAILLAGVARERIEAAHVWDEADETRLWSLCLQRKLSSSTPYMSSKMSPALHVRRTRSGTEAL
ncbi:hypothetical protein LTR35_002886 [Friedmanniomyces endolithicus]|uniref:F-box domain-containing protein n=1 Tax=Friedmanniomyces endolithicus TaxID=329885 RepID=A0AAN6JG57_9PEZI|nr:hypothetical protein LTS00_014470 [Friedmanniomyces endolithicus]KAK0289688.1 hypothetical protein LTR35_002886 [Friedmanniomyces endolithicus]KAK0328536.1 hypothetical protein LTR82_000467 [Friedmanniomyces endolithicus]KAK1019767.1 hypothetical protein LTR54_000410 [Friedmanniomyces endolithicus]